MLFFSFCHRTERIPWTGTPCVKPTTPSRCPWPISTCSGRSSRGNAAIRRLICWSIATWRTERLPIGSVVTWRPARRNTCRSANSPALPCIVWIFLLRSAVEILFQWVPLGFLGWGKRILGMIPYWLLLHYFFLDADLETFCFWFTEAFSLV